MKTGTLTRTYNPRGAALQVFAERGPEVLLSGPAGTGKSRACLEKLHAVALANPGMRGLIVRKTLTSLGSTALVTWREHVIKEALSYGLVKFYGGSAQESAQYRYSNGSVVVVGGMDKATRIMSSEYDIVYVQEAIELTEADWEAITTRLRNGKVSFQQLIADTNPDTPTHWLRQRIDRGQTTCLESRHGDNPVLVTDSGDMTPVGKAYISKLDALTGPRKSRLRDGKWVSAEGVIYEDFDRAVHLVDPFEIPQNWPRFWSVDFGFTNPFVLQCWAEDPDGRGYLYRELFMSQRTVDVHAQQIMRIVCPGGVMIDGRYTGGHWIEPKPSAIVADHDAGDRATFTKVTGLQTRAAKKTVDVGIQAVQRRLKRADDGRPRLLLVRDALIERDPVLEDAKRPVSTIEEFPGYVWDKTAGKQLKESPLKENDHGMDATRYYVMERESGGINRVRFIRS